MKRTANHRHRPADRVRLFDSPRYRNTVVYPLHKLREHPLFYKTKTEDRITFVFQPLPSLEKYLGERAETRRRHLAFVQTLPQDIKQKLGLNLELPFEKINVQQWHGFTRKSALLDPYTTITDILIDNSPLWSIRTLYIEDTAELYIRTLYGESAPVLTDFLPITGYLDLPDDAIPIKGIQKEKPL